MGGYYCSHCEKLNLCPCKSCKVSYGVDIGDMKFGVWTADGNGIECQYCGKAFSLDASLEIELKKYKT